MEEVESEQPQTSQPQTTKSTLAPKVVHQVVIDDDDEEVEVVSEQKSLKCPFTQVTICLNCREASDLKSFFLLGSPSDSTAVKFS